MKITKVNNYTFPAKNAQGSQRVLESLSKELTKQGHSIELLISQDSIVPSEYGKLVNKVSEDTDIIHLHGGLLYEYNLLPVKPWITTAHGGATDAPERLTEVGKYVDNIVFVSNFCSKMYNSDCFVYACADKNEFQFQEKKDNYFLWMAGTDWGNQKGLFHTILLAKKLGFKLKIAGGGKNQEIIDEIKKNQNSKIEYLGFVNGKEKTALLAAARATFMIGTILDACPLTSIESWASGTPVIARNVGVHPEVVKSDVGFVCNSEIDIIKAIATIDKIKPLDCRRYFLENFTSEIAAKKYVEIYKNVLKTGKVIVGCQER